MIDFSDVGIIFEFQPNHKGRVPIFPGIGRHMSVFSYLNHEIRDDIR